MHKTNNVFPSEELAKLQQVVDNARPTKIHEGLGRTEKSETLSVPREFLERATEVAKQLSGKDSLLLTSATAVEYNNKYGEPVLPPHFDGDTNDLIMDFQLESNTSWSIGINLDVYPMEDNSALLFNPNTNIHWRPIKKFEDGEFVKMMFFRFKDSSENNDYTGVGRSQDHEVFREANELRNSL
jgi:hypothetical protein